MNFLQPRFTYFLKKTKKMPLPCVKSVLICDMLKSCRLVQHFLKNCLPAFGIECFKLCAVNQIDISCYLLEIIKTSYRIRVTLTLTNFKINGAQLQKLLFANRHKEEIIFEKCKLWLQKAPSLSKHLKGTTIQYLSLFNCEGPD
ncbi:unnamed protein product [Moneuplotes crassus]|uniref:Uncharacterized protein n=1 Tax=Euplotes crassus TaxID=5936 RepID=A0AAD1UQ47_EUPCR|nr:unnamed protein product [Moneuplotes crassus]